MTYKLNPILEKISSPIRLMFPSGVCKEYNNGQEVIDEVFDNKYEIMSIYTSNHKIEVILGVARRSNEYESFF